MLFPLLFFRAHTFASPLFLVVLIVFALAIVILGSACHGEQEQMQTLLMMLLMLLLRWNSLDGACNDIAVNVVMCGQYMPS